MTLTIKHLFKDGDYDYDCQVTVLEHVRYFEMKRTDHGLTEIVVYYEEGSKEPSFFDFDTFDDSYDLLECYQPV